MVTVNTHRDRPWRWACRRLCTWANPCADVYVASARRDPLTVFVIVFVVVIKGDGWSDFVNGVNKEV